MLFSCDFEDYEDAKLKSMQIFLIKRLQCMYKKYYIIVKIKSREYI